jgi:hypothetical protein
VAVATENGEVITMESVDEVEEAADEVIEEVVFDPNVIAFSLAEVFYFSGGHGPVQAPPTPPIPA